MTIRKTCLWLVAAFQVAYISCGQPEKNTELKKAESKNEANIDTADQGKVIGDISFGITEKEFQKLSKKFIQKSTRRNEFDIDQPFIGDYKYSDISPYFDNNKLYKVWITGATIGYDNYKSKLIDQVNAIKLVLEKKYGTATGGSGPPPMYKTEKGFNYLAYSWEIGSKEIDVKVSDTGTLYSVDLVIFNRTTESRIAESTNKVEENIAEKAKSDL